ncbi:hypothetical protein M1437_01595 [Patescibacteria group bacterium]|nr:hypothetical protein [Patescibacteria group bacterium]
MNKLLFILVAALTILVIGSFLLISFFNSKKESEPIKPVIQASFTPTPYRPALPSPAITKILTLVSVNPTEDTSQTYFPIKQIFFTFNQPMNPSSFVAEASPSVKIITTLKPDDPNTIIISPDKSWQPGITTITILSTTTALSGSKLDKSVVYKINTKFPENPPPDSPGL